MKRGLSIALVFLFMLNILSINVFADGTSGNAPYKIWVASNSVKVMKDQQPIENAGQILEFEAARNEYESGQLIVTAGESPLSISDVSVTDLVCSESDVVYGKIPAGDISISVQHYINVTKTVTSVPTGWYPDALIPVDRYMAQNNKVINVEAKKNQGLWFSVKVPKDIPSGLYTGTVNLSVSGNPAQVPVSFRVWDFELTDESHSKTAFAIWPDMFKFAYPGTDYESGNLTAEQKAQAKTKVYQLMEKYTQFLLKYRLTSTDIPYPEDNISAFVEKAKEHLANNPGLTGYRIPYNNNNLEWSKAFINALSKAGILDKGYIYAVDEPSTSEALKHTMDVCNNIEQIRTELGINRIRNLITMDFDKNFYGKVNLWCPILTSYGSGDFANTAKDRIGAGDEVWWYTCVHPVYPYPSYHINDYLTGARLLSWMQKSYGIQGNLYWCTNVFGQFRENPWGYINRDVWNDPFAFPGAAGDGYLLYPGVDYGTEDPFPTVRLEAIREGNEDYEYLWLLDEKLRAAASKLGIQVNADDVLKPVFERLFKNVKDYKNDAELLKAARREVAEMIIALDKNPSAIIILGNLTEDYESKNIKIYAESGSSVRINGVDAARTGTEGSADVFDAAVPCQLGTNTVRIDVQKDDKTVTYNRIFVVAVKAPELYPVELYYAEDESELSRWSKALNCTVLPPVEHSTDFVTQGTKGLKVTFPGNGPDNWPAIDLNSKQGGLYHTDWSNFKTLEFDISSPTQKTNWVYIRVFDSAHNYYEQYSTLGTVENQHVSIPISTLASNIDIKDVEIVRFYSGKEWMDGEDLTVYIDNLHFTAEQRFSMYPAISTGKVNESDVDIDGDIGEAVWTGRINREIKIPLYGTPDNKAKFGTLWDDTNLYVAVDVEDEDVVSPTGENPWDDDDIEIFIDGSMNKDVYDSRTAQYHFRFGDNTVHKGPTNSMATTDGISYKMVKSDKGYRLEAAIPWSAINTTVQAEKYVGFNVQINDRDTDSYSIIGLVRNESGKENWFNSENWADLKLMSNQIYKVDESNIRIDGKIDELYWYLDKELRLKTFGEPNNNARFGTLWNEKYLYAAFDVKDDFVKNTGSENCWDDDSVEFFVDLNLAKGPYSRNTTTVAQFTFKYDDSTVYIDGLPASTYHGVDGSAVKHASWRTDNGYTVEIAIPWAAFGGAAVQEGKVIGLTAQMNDKDIDDPAKYSQSGLGYSTNDPANCVSSENWPEFRISGETAKVSDVTSPVWPEGAKLTVADITETSVQLSWPAATDNIGVEGYDVYVNSKLAANVKDSYTYKVDKLLPGTEYTFKVFAKDQINESHALTAEATTMGLTPLDNDIIVFLPVFTDNTGKVIDRVNKGEDIRVSVKVKNNNGSESREAMVIAALYDSQNNMVDIAATQEQLIKPGETSELNGCLKVPHKNSGYYVKVFVWDNREHMNPLSKVICFPQQ